MLEGELGDIGLSLPHHRRWPFIVNLGEHEDRVRGGEDVPLVRYMADKISSRSPVPVTPAQFLTWLREWPSFLVLDGLDEVAAPSVRAKITQAVSEFLVDAVGERADVMLVVTTRPQGYMGEFGAEQYEQLEMLPLDEGKAVQCARRLGQQRLGDDDDLREKVLQRMTAATQERDTKHLLTTPLQVTIMQLLLERRQRVPHDRFQLFQGYFDTIYAREQNKPGFVGQLLEEHRNHVIAVHEQIALRLHVNSETPDYSQVPVARSVLEDMIRARLQKEEHSGAEINKLTAHLIAAATQRLVLLVPALDENIGFEVRSLREFMAARALTSGKDEVVLERLASLAASAHWRNVWLFAAGRLFLDREHLRDSILTLLRGVDTESLLSLVVRPGAVLATALLGDDLAARSPRYRRLLAAHATERVSALRDENVFDLGGVTSLAAVVFLAAEDDAIISASVRRTMDQALASDARVGTTAAWLLAMWSAWTGELAAWARSRTGGSSVLPKESGFSDGSNSKNGPESLTYLRPFLQVIEPAGADAKFIALLEAVDLRLTVVQDLDGEVGGAIRISQRTLPEILILKDVFDVPDLADIYADLVDSVSSDNLWVASALKSIASYWFWRKPVSHMLR